MTSPSLRKVSRHPVANRPSWVNYAWSIGTAPIRNPILEHLALLFGIVVFLGYILKLRGQLFIFRLKTSITCRRSRKLSRKIRDLVAKTDETVAENRRRSVLVNQLLDERQGIQCHNGVLAIGCPNTQVHGAADETPTTSNEQDPPLPCNQ